MAQTIGIILEYSNIHKALNVHIPKKYKKYYKDLKKDKLFHPQTIFINESGLYRLIMRSKQENAIKFQDWITDDLLPSLRQQGNYKLKKEIYDKITFKFDDILKSKDEIIQKLTKKLHKEVYDKSNLVYVHTYTTYEDRPLYKIGYSKKLDKRILNYGVGKTDNGSIVFHIKCYNMKLIEQVLKHKLKWCLYDHNKELVDIKLDKLIDIIKETVYDIDDKIIKEDIHDLLIDSENEITNKETKIIEKLI